MERATVVECQGCYHYRKLLTSPGKPIPSLELDPGKVTESSGRSIISEEEYYQEFGDVEWHNKKRKFYAPVFDEQLAALAREKDSLQRSNRRRKRSGRAKKAQGDPEEREHEL